ncbi:hypothetical protein PtrSN001C_008520 [Pyrenophora tritici-repentis]|nr:hypothetical protein PtrSN001A_009745 [Pyrenophora tritici-repentis]KAI1530905.1 hypothetical protein PtrSN001C_008520 [Pyrenophora tritici-repentis]
MQDHYLRPETYEPGKKRIWVGDACIARLVNFVEEKRNGGTFASPESFFDGRGPDMRLFPTSDADAGLYAAIRLYKNWEWKDGEKEESRMFHAIERHRNAKWGFQIENEKRAAEDDRNGNKKKMDEN